MELKIRGIYNLLEVGFPIEKLIGCITLTNPIVESVKETLDWFIDEIGLKHVTICSLKGIGFGKDLRHLELTQLYIG